MAYTSLIRPSVTSREGRVSRNYPIRNTAAAAYVTSREGRVSRNRIVASDDE